MIKLDYKKYKFLIYYLSKIFVLILIKRNKSITKFTV